ncbi:MAG: hypothetical protein LBK29_00950 [Oscillospiraceae bacterium]|jgi:chromosome segregation ATPase|nr:hypothetical protein [Oscillospiraceae bacterium]
MRRPIAILLAMCFVTNFCNSQESESKARKTEKVNQNSLYLLSGLVIGVLSTVVVSVYMQKQMQKLELHLAGLRQSLQIDEKDVSSDQIRKLEYRIAELTSKLSEDSELNIKLETENDRISELSTNLGAREDEIQRLNSDIEDLRRSLIQSRELSGVQIEHDEISELERLRSELEQCQIKKQEIQTNVKGLASNRSKIADQHRNKQAEIAQLQGQMVSMSKALKDHMEAVRALNEQRIAMLKEIHRQEKIEKQSEDFKKLIDEISKDERGVVFLERAKGVLRRRS